MEVQIQVSNDGGTVWVNNATSCIGRFSKKFGMDIHRPVEDQMAGEPQCLHCTHTAGTPSGWLEFCRLMKVHFGVVVPLETITFTVEK